MIVLALLCTPAFGQTTAIDWLNKGNALVDLGRYNESILSYDRAIELNPQYANAWNNKGNALVNLGRYNESILSYDRPLS